MHVYSTKVISEDLNADQLPLSEDVKTQVLYGEKLTNFYTVQSHLLHCIE